MVNTVFRLVLAAGVAVAGGALAHPGHDDTPRPGANGIGYDADGDSNPAVNTRLIARIGDAAEASLDPPFQIVTFEAGKHDDTIREAKIDSRTVKFSKGLKRQICDNELFYKYDTECSYLAAPSGKFAAVYRDEFGRALRVRFENPVCAAALAVYPTGGAEGETYKVVLQPYDADERELSKVEYTFDWTKDTFRWRLMAGAFFLGEKPSRVDVNVVSKTSPSKVVRFLIDDVAFIEDDCSIAMADINAEGGFVASVPDDPPNAGE